MKKVNRMGYARQAGVTLMEVLITVVVLGLGLLGLAQMIGRTTAQAVDANQRARAVVLLQDIQERVINTRTGDWTAAAGEYGASVSSSCDAEGTARGQACRWGNVIAGAGEGGAMAMRGCITASDATGRVFDAAVAWSSTSSGIAPPDGVSCGQTMMSDGKDSHRRVAVLRIELPVLSSSGLGTVAEPAAASAAANP